MKDNQVHTFNLMTDAAECQKPSASSDDKAPKMEKDTLETHGSVAAERALYESQLDAFDSSLEELKEMTSDSDDE